MNEKRLTRSSNNKIFLGVLGGLADYIGVDATWVRLIYVLLSVMSTGFPGLLVYVILAIVMPEAKTVGTVNSFSDEEVIIKEP